MLGRNLQGKFVQRYIFGKICKCTPHAEEKVNFRAFLMGGEMWMVGVVNLAVLQF